MLSNMQWGSVAEWFTGLITALGIYIAIRESKLRIKLKHRIIKNKIMLEIHNKSSFKIEINNLYTYYYVNIFTTRRIGNAMFFLAEEGKIILEPYETKKFDVSIELHNYNKTYVYLKCGCEYQGGLIKENKLRKRVRVDSFEAE